MNKAIVCMFDNKMVNINTDIPYSISVNKYLRPSQPHISDGYRLIISQQGIEERVNLGKVTEEVAKEILKDVIKFMVDNEKLFQIN